MAPRRPEAVYGPDRESELAHLTASIGHSIINALTAVVSNAEILKLSEPAGEQHGIADAIIDAAMSASKVTRRLVELTRPSTEIARGAPVPLSPLIRAAARDWDERAEGPISWEFDLDEGVAPLGLEDQLRAMLDQIIANASESFGAAGGRISARLTRDPEGWATLCIADDGPGMTPTVCRHATDPFFTTKPGRLGLGLTLALGIWRRHAGTLSIRSDPGLGTELHLTVPAPPGAG